ncbi:MAG: DNA/RNA non-specific endonuclease, partial [Chloroflexi bacterium]|nr:DNA/RNA non-specific endonuclease [Chloroflexota bacterium]
MPLSTLTPLERARKHPIVYHKPASNFFEGALLGNGGLGAVVTTRPDAVVVHFGHNNVWDVRVAENNQDKIGSFQTIFEKVQAIPSDYATLEQDEWYREYCELMQQNYRAPYPRPFPCGTLVLGFDRREAELLGHRLDVATGLCEVFLLAGGQRRTLQLFTDMAADRLWLRFVDADGQPAPSPFERIRLLPDPATPDDIPPFTTAEDPAANSLSFRQVLPALPGNAQNDRAFRLSARANVPLACRSRINWSGVTESMGPLERALADRAPLLVCVQLDEGSAAAIGAGVGDVPAPSADAFEAARAAAGRAWEAYWAKSGVALEDELLERTWYWNLYFLNCAARAGANCPGLFANWSYRDIGTAWHGDYHMNYNTQQPFWCTFSSNHVEKHLPYVELVHFLLPLSRKWAREYYGLRGAYFPHSAYPTEMNVMPYPVPTWGWEICETPWTVQSLWWHYTYTQDRAFLAQRAFEPIKDAVLFLVDYSAVMNGARRLAYFTAVNIDGKAFQDVSRDSDRWSFDPRIDRNSQIGSELYGDNDLDFGHLVRRLDAAWGSTPQVARIANDDTFHLTNCAPQHKLFNRNKSTWAGLEDYILSNAIATNLKVSVFTGPVFGDGDPEYRGVKLPQQYWKVVVILKQGGG